MRFRKLAAVAAALAVASAALAGCNTKVGTAAVVDGHHISDSDVSKYLTPKAQPVSTQNASGSSSDVPPRSFVLNTLIESRLLDTLLAKFPGGHPKESAISSEITSELAGHKPTEAAKSSGVVGYTAAFVDVWVRVAVLSNVISNLAQQGTVDVQKLLTALSFPVTVSGRYGSWNPKTFSIDSAPGVGTPGFIKLSPVAVGTAASPAG